MRIGKVVAAPIRVLADQTFGKSHKLYHRLLIGLLVTLLGTILLRWVHFEQTHSALLWESFTTLVQGIGGAPLAEGLAKLVSED